MDVVFRVDGNGQIGLGHLFRCIALAQMLANEFNIFFFCKQVPLNVAQQIEKLGYQLIRINTEEEFLAVLDLNTIVVLDHYTFDADHLRTIKNSGSKLVLINDYADDVSQADLVINHAPHVELKNYTIGISTQFAVGLEFALLRPAFLAQAKKEKLTKELTEIFVCFGGADPKNLTQVTVDLLKEDKRFGKINIVVGEAYGPIEKLVRSIEHDERFIAHHGINEGKICELISNSLLAIVPASGILLEAIAVGNHIISGMYVENQKDFYDNYRKLDIFFDAGNFSKIGLRSAIDDFFNRKDKLKPELIDGKSDQRLLNAFKQLVNEREITLRLASTNDLMITYEWATDKIIRAFSHNTGHISIKEHSKWFLGKIVAPNCKYFIASLKGRDIGSIRYDIEEKKATISYLLDTSFHKMGLGVLILKLGLIELMKIQGHENISEILGSVLTTNISSIKAFEKLGYLREVENGNFKFIKEIKNEN